MPPGAGVAFDVGRRAQHRHNLPFAYRTSSTRESLVSIRPARSRRRGGCQGNVPGFWATAAEPHSAATGRSSS